MHVRLDKSKTRKLEFVLEIFLITYNRSSYLDDTLRKLKDSPFARCRFTVLDNCSTDDTPQIAAKYHEYFLDYHVIRHPLNIGGDANYLRAVELSTTEYTWILCDDDFYDFSAVDEVVGILQGGIHDLVIVGPIYPTATARKCSSTIQELVRTGFLPHFTFSFFPAVIFRTALFGYECVASGYKFCADCYPNFPFINKSYNDNVFVYIPSSPLVVRNNTNSSVMSPLTWYNYWLNCCVTIPERRLRYSSIEQATKKMGFIMSLGFWIILEKHVAPDQFYKKISNIFLSMNVSQKLRFLLLIPTIIIKFPLHYMLLIRNYIYYLMRVPENEIPPVKVVDRDK